jgi:HAD superfamily hydrolase (TIGR01509 family)
MNESRIRAVLFDMDGVLVDSYEAWFYLMNAAAVELGYPPISREQFQGVWGQGPDLDVELFFTRHTVAQVAQYYNQRFRDYGERVRINRWAKPVFDALREQGRKIAVITNTPSPIARDLLSLANLEPHALVGGTDVARGKPAPDMVFKALKLLEVSHREAVFVGDSQFDHDAAMAARVRFEEYHIQKDGVEQDLEQVIRSFTI